MGELGGGGIGGKVMDIPPALHPPPPPDPNISWTLARNMLCTQMMRGHRGPRSTYIVCICIGYILPEHTGINKVGHSERRAQVMQNIFSFF